MEGGGGAQLPKERETTGQGTTASAVASQLLRNYASPVAALPFVQRIWNIGWREKLPDGGQLLRSCRRAAASLHGSPPSLLFVQRIWNIGWREKPPDGVRVCMRSSFSPFSYNGNGYLGWREKPPDGERWQIDGPCPQPPGPRRNLVSLSTPPPARNPPRQNLSPKVGLRPRSGDKSRAGGADPLPADLLNTPIVKENNSVAPTHTFRPRRAHLSIFLKPGSYCVRRIWRGGLRRVVGYLKNGVPRVSGGCSQGPTSC
jgi:hypothetical protein